MIDPFIMASGIAYYVILLFPKRITNLPNRILEKISMGVMGSLLLGNLFIFQNFFMWMALGILYVPASILSYLHYVKWYIQGERVNDLTQNMMFLWDLILSMVCLSKVLGGIL